MSSSSQVVLVLRGAEGGPGENEDALIAEDDLVTRRVLLVEGMFSNRSSLGVEALGTPLVVALR